MTTGASSRRAVGRLDGMRYGALPWLGGLALAAAAAAQGLDLSGRLPALCGTLGAKMLIGSANLALAAVPAANLALSWVLMVVGMMPPLAAAAVNHATSSSLPRRRRRSAGLVLLGYLSPWLAAGLLLVPAGVVVMIAFGEIATPAVLGLAIAWTCSPVAQIARNRCHRLSRLGLRGWRADRDCVLQGTSLAAACLVACWPWMLLLTTIGQWHQAAMTLIAVGLFLERTEPSAAATWRLPPLASLALRATR